MGFIVRIVASGFFLFMLGGCALFAPKPPPPPMLPAGAVVIGVDHFTGTPLSGPLATTPALVRPDGAMKVDLTFFAVERVPFGTIDPLASSARLILTTRGAVPVRSGTRLTRSAGYAFGAPADRFSATVKNGGLGRSVSLAQIQGALPPGATVRFEVSDSSSAQAPGESARSHRRLAIELHAPPMPAATTAPAATVPAAEPTVQLAVVLEDLAGPDNAGADLGDDTPAAGATPTLQQETVILDPQAVKDSLELAVMLPFKFRDGTNAGVVAIIHVAPGSVQDPVHQQACVAAAADLQRAYAAVTARLAANPDAATVFGALDAILQPNSRRSALAFLCGWSGAWLCEDVVLSADDATLATLAGSIATAIGQAPGAKPVVAWQMDRAALDLLFKLQSDNQLPPELAAVLSDRAGEVGRHASSMEEVLGGLQGPEELLRRLYLMNYDYLQDSSPGSRARAFEWLRSRELAPAGYDPLGPPKERKAALDKAAAARTSAPQPGAAP